MTMADGSPTLLWSQKKRVDPIMQSEAAECALACLAMLAQFYGNHCGLPALRRRYSSTLKGMSLNQVIEVADDMGFDCRALRAELDYLREVQAPVILHWNMNHFVVLAGTKGSKLVIIDPAQGRRLMPMGEVSKYFTGVLLELEPSASFRRASKSPTVPLSALTGRISGLKRVLIQIFALALAIEALGLSIPLQAQWAVDQISESNGKVILTVAAIFSLVIIIQAGLNLARAWLISWLGANISTQWVINIFSHLMRLPLDFFEKRHLGDIMSRFGSIHWIQAILTGSFVTALLDGLTGSLALALLFIYSTGIATIAVVVATLYALGRFLMFGALWRASEQSMVLDARQQSELMESVRGIQAIKLANRQLERRARLANATLEAAKRGVTAERIKLGFGAASQGIFGLQRVFLLSAGAYLISRNAMTAGMMVAALSYADQFSTRVGSLIDNAVELKMLGLHLNRLADITTADEEPARGRLEGALRSAPEVQMKGLGYRYSEWEPWIFRNLSFTIAPGQSVALVGPSGCGKTTLAKIVLGLLAPQEGEVTVTDQPRPVCRSAIPAEGMAAVMQDDCLFSGTIADNVAFFDSSAELSEIEAAARAAGIHDEILKMPMGYETLVGDMGSTLSGGQKQRLLLARALYRQPKILVLDEATSHLDSDNEKVVNDAVMDLEITRIIIAHRKETIAMADRVFDLSTQTWIR
ncbi:MULTISPECIES: peptidase domain-containing ABC transporter [Xanthomonas]|uniref:Colicin V secretion ABC transporter ATP-binding protein n=2 Tax=Xanthomonas TaxID=338 RepID=A0A7Z7IYY1_XANCH|nr:MULTISPECIES: peptidase domain-containing ABC transporter [Xanthomonas]ATS36937.1 peptidase domain-containing ABC transporter [Xanthomonas citri pv. phaseoli var. fuscans]ATS44253.1 peptidase domain-containing ABC transporter [Xanthomonas citri pv. phaseoli var. fuscans]ATS48835.1 peptidase domain-containing ABC transporter [Xanthomonas citri pv. phaseoli var. fuscans]ATS84791.1 peptidase domain-containing ABC transporter [Xanthomonas citri pv. phaseoli var. fuscans]QWN22436.1 peptidase dom